VQSHQKHETASEWKSKEVSCARSSAARLLNSCKSNGAQFNYWYEKPRHFVPFRCESFSCLIFTTITFINSLLNAFGSNNDNLLKEELAKIGSESQRPFSYGFIAKSTSNHFRFRQSVIHQNKASNFAAQSQRHSWFKISLTDKEVHFIGSFRVSQNDIIVMTVTQLKLCNTN